MAASAAAAGSGPRSAGNYVGFYAVNRAAEIAIEAAAERAGWEHSRTFTLMGILDGNGRGSEGAEFGPGVSVEVPVFSRNQGGISRAEALDPGYAHGAIPVAWGRYYAKLPWPKYDQKKARAAYAKAMQINPANLRARLFLAELMIEEDQPDEGRRLLEEVVKATPGKYDAPEERRCQRLAAAALAKLKP